MPIYEYVCDECGARYERLVMSQTQSITCPKCSSDRHTLQLSVFSANTKSNGSAGASITSGACGCTPKTCGCN